MVDSKGPGNGALLFLRDRRDNVAMTTPEQAARQAAWNAYWATGGLHSCIGSYAGNYAGAIGEFWQRQFAGLGPADRVLDLATGNGPLPLMLWESSPADCPQVDAVDLARMAPRWYRPEVHAAISFHPGIAMERLPFPDGVFDLAVSQFGFEYAQRGPALRECLRVTAGGGRIAFVMHHAGSVLVDVGRGELANGTALLAPGGLLAAAGGVIPWFARARAGEDLSRNAEALAKRGEYNDAMRRLAGQAQASRAPDLLLEARDWVHRLLASVGVDPEPAQRLLAGYRDALGSAGLRTAEMIEHALDEAAVRDMVAQIDTHRPGASVDVAPLQQREGVLGWALRVGPAS